MYKIWFDWIRGDRRWQFAIKFLNIEIDKKASEGTSRIKLTVTTSNLNGIMIKPSNQSRTKIL